MEHRTLGKTSMQVSVLGFGGSEIGYGNASVEIVSRLLGSALDSGLNVIDTAECYMTSEELIGRAVSHRRQDYYLFTSVDTVAVSISLTGAGNLWRAVSTEACEDCEPTTWT